MSHELLTRNYVKYYPKIIESIRETAYQGYFGLEYWPTYHHETSVKDTLAWLKTGL